jgi:hypothetical protein
MNSHFSIKALSTIWISNPRIGIKNLALEAETELTYLPYTEQEGLRFQIARNLQSLYRHYENNKGHNKKNMNSGRHTIQSIKSKLQTNKALITKADKGNTIVITYQQDYWRKTEDFIENNNLIIANNDPTKTFQKKVRIAVNECQIVVHKDERWKYINMNPASPTIRGMIKIHKADAPIRPVINWRSQCIDRSTRTQKTSNQQYNKQQ